MHIKPVICFILILLLVPCVSATTVVLNTTPENDGIVGRVVANSSWGSIRDGAGNYVILTQNWVQPALNSGAITNEYASNFRGVLIFPTDTLPDDATITGAKISLYGVSYNNANLGSDSVSIVPFTIDGTISADDYDNFIMDKSATDAGTIAGMWDIKYYNWTLNTNGINNISKTAPSGFGVVFAKDISNTSPTWASGTYNRWYFNATTLGYAQAPLLTVDYTLPDTEPPESITALANSSITDTSINWSWTNPGGDYSYITVWKNNVWFQNISTPTAAIRWTGLTNNTVYTFSAKAVDTNGNINATWVNATATTNTLPAYLSGDIINPDFENGDLWGWTSGGTSSPVISANAHAGSYSGKPVTWHAADSNMSQIINFTGISNISFYYSMASGTGENGTYTVYLDGDATTLSYVAGSWSNKIINTSAYPGLHTLKFRAASTGVNESNLYIDDITTNPGVITTILTTYPMKINATKVLPYDDTSSVFDGKNFYFKWNSSMYPPAGTTVSINITPGAYEAASFFIKSTGSTTGINFTTSNLSDGAGHTILATDVDIRLVKVLFQANPYDVGLWGSKTKPDGPDNPIMVYNYLTPVMLLKNDSLFTVNYTQQANYIWRKNNTQEGYFRLDNTTTGWGWSDWKVYDNATATGYPQPLSLADGEMREIWLTTNASSTQTAGNYTGTITINSTTAAEVTMDFNVRVLPFALVNATKDNGLLYCGVIDNIGYYTPYHKSPAMYARDMESMYAHGFRYPTFAQDNDSYMGTAFYYMNITGFPTDKIMLVPGGGWKTTYSDYFGTPSSAGDLTIAANKVKMWRNHTETWGYKDTYFYGLDENVSLTEQFPVWSTIRNNSGKIYITYPSNQGVAYHKAHAYVDWNDFAAGSAIANLNNTEATLWVNQGSLISSYTQPRTGVDNPEIYRARHGLKLWISSFTGSIETAYQQFAGNPFNDFDSATLADHMPVYDTTTGHIPTNAYEGYREGIDDQRYADTLTDITGSNVSARTIVANGIANKQEMSDIRISLIEALLAYGEGPPAPYALYTVSKSVVRVPDSVIFTDASTGTPTSWNWSFSDGTYAETQNATHKFVSRGYKRVCLVATNAGGSSELCDYIRVIGF